MALVIRLIVALLMAPALVSSFLLPPSLSASSVWDLFKNTASDKPQSTSHWSDSIPAADLTFQKPQEEAKKPTLVPVSLAVMSQCPDAQLCETVWDKSLNQVSDKVDTELVYIGEFSNTAKYGVECKHGEGECDGNVQQLCFRELYPDLSKWWQFVQCQNFGPNKNIGSLKVARDCARSVGLQWEKDGLEECASGDQGTQLLQKSVQKAQDLHIERSCSVLIDGELVCVHDGVWKECDNGHEAADFVRQVKEAYDRLN